MYPKIELIMTKRINYEDDIFFLLLLLRRLQEGLKLSIDMEFFGSKVVDDILFIDEKMEAIFNLLKGHSILLGGEEYLVALKKVLRNFIDLLEDIMGNKFPGSYYFSDLRISFEKLVEKSRNILTDVEQMIRELGKKEEEVKQIVSEEEFKFLLSDGEEDSL